jgi:hypothetical protein
MLLLFFLAYLAVLLVYLFHGIDCRYDADRCQVQVGLGVHGSSMESATAVFLSVTTYSSTLG